MGITETGFVTIPNLVAVAAVLTHIALSDRMIARVYSYYVRTGWMAGGPLTEEVHFKFETVIPQLVIDALFVVGINIILGWGLIATGLALCCVWMCRLMLYMGVINRSSQSMLTWRFVHIVSMTFLCYLPAIFAAGTGGKMWTSTLFHW